MSRTITSICDKCKKEFKDSEHLHRLTEVTFCTPAGARLEPGIELCNECVKKLLDIFREFKYGKKPPNAR
jgi:hypothetical protein